MGPSGVKGALGVKGPQVSKQEVGPVVIQTE